MRTRSCWLPALAALFCLHYACGSESDAPTSQTGPDAATGGTVTIFGHVTIDDNGADAAPAAGARVTVHGDFDGDGQTSAAESVEASVDDQGDYRLDLELDTKVPLVISVRGDGILGNFERVEIVPPGAVRVDSVVHSGDVLVSTATHLELEDRRLRIGGLPEGFGGHARVFNPATEFDAFPGDFVDEEGTRIVSASFAKVELQDAEGNDVHELASPAVLEMAVPRDTWRVLRDMEPGNSRVDVPRYFFDEQKGQWICEGMGHLVTGTGRDVAEEDLAAILDGSFEDDVLARYEVTHFSTYNVDFPQNRKPNKVKGKAKAEKSLKERFKDWFNCKLPLGGQCGGEPPPESEGPKRRRDLKEFEWKAPSTRSLPLTPRDVGDSALDPLTSGFIRAHFFYEDHSYAGYVSEEVEADGSFSFPVGQSEPDGVDLDDNGMAGEKLYVVVMLEWYGFQFHLVEGVVPTHEDQFADMGDVDIFEGLLSPERCEVSGTVLYPDGTPAAGASVYYASNPPMTDQQWITLCGEDGSGCEEWTETGDDGSFVLSWPYLGTLAVEAYVEQNEGSTFWYGLDYKTWMTCPPGPVEMVLDSGEATTDLQVTAEGSTIVWEPEREVDRLWVWDAEGNTKWGLAAGTASISAPIEFGVVPPGTVEESPSTGPLEPGDFVAVEARTKTSMGYPEYLFGEAYVQ